MLTTCYVLNKVPNKNNKTTPYELCFKRTPNLSYFPIWGCRAVVKLTGPNKNTLGERGVECIFIGNAQHYNAYRFYVIDPNESVSVNTMIESRDVGVSISRVRVKKVWTSSDLGLLRVGCRYPKKWVSVFSCFFHSFFIVFFPAFLQLFSLLFCCFFHALFLVFLL